MDPRQGEYVVDLYKDGYFFASRSMTCGPKAFKDAVAQWKRKGYVVKTTRQPKLV